MKHSENFEILSKIYSLQQRRTKNKGGMDTYFEQQEENNEIMKIVRTESILLKLRAEWFVEDWNKSSYSFVNMNLDPQWIISKKWNLFLERYPCRLWNWKYTIEDNQVTINFILTFLSLLVAILALLH